VASIGLGFTLSANAQQMASGINAGVTELQKLGYAAKKTQADVSTLKSIELSRVFISAVQGAASGFTSFVAGAASAVASVDDLSKRTGVSAQTLQGYQFAAEQSGVGIETFGKSIQKLLINLGEAQTGNKTAIKSFADLGISVQELAGLTPEQTFERVAAAITQLPNPAQQAAAAVGLFGKAGAELVPVFQEGAGFLAEMRAEAERLGLVLNQDQVQGLATLDDTIGKVSASFQALQARIVAELAPALTQVADEGLAFIASIDVQEVARSAESAIAGLADAARAAGVAFQLIYATAAPLAAAVLPVIGETLRFIVQNLQGAALGALAAAGAFAGYSLSAVTAAGATAAFTAAITALLSRTGVGLLVVVLGAAAGAFINYAAAGEDSSSAVKEAVAGAESQMKKAEEATKAATSAAAQFGETAKQAFKLPAQITNETLLQGTIDEATNAFRKFAQEAGNLSAVPKELADAFAILQTDIDNINGGFVDAAAGQDLIARSAAEVLAITQRITREKQAETDATNAVADAARKASEEAAKRVQGLAESGVTDAEQSRLQYTQDLLAIQQTIADAEKALADARKTNDLQAISDAEKRLQLVRETAGVAVNAAKQQKRERDLSALGLDQGLLKPAQTITDEFKKVQVAVNRGLIDSGQAFAAIDNLAAEGISIRKEIAAELARPSQNALTVSDVRTQQGASEFLRLATGRADPAIEQRAQQLAKLEEIRRGLVAIGANPVDILGA
jgi:hypothetical protein